MEVERRRWLDRPRLRFGLQARMTASYVLVTATAVIVVEAIAIGVLLPSYLADQDLNNRVVYTAGNLAERVGIASLSTTRIQLPPGFVIGAPSSIGPGQVQNDGQGLVIPQVTQAFAADAPPLSVALVLSNVGTVLASSYPDHYPAGASIDSLLPAGGKSIAFGSKGTISDTATGRVAWAVQPVMIQLSQNRGAPPPGTAKNASPDGWVYVQAPLQPLTLGSVPDTGPWLGAGLIVLLLALPVGAVFGLITTRGVVRRLRRLAGTTALVAEGDFNQRLVAGPHDEVGRLERNFNEMAERLSAAVSRERQLADKSARLAERGRISRELHDSISQDLFSISLLAAGLEKALPDDSPLRHEVHTLTETAQATNREMRALLLELRPAILEEQGLTVALEELASAYAARLGIRIDAELDTVHLPAAAELAALRIAQEALANAVKHARATAIKLALHRRDGHADLTISDDGAGFDPAANGAVEGLGLRLMRERIEELDGTLTITSRSGEGTVVQASIPGAVD